MNRNNPDSFDKEDDFRSRAEKHWDYTRQLIEKTNPNQDTYDIELIHFLYVESMIHGYKHKTDSLIQSGDTK
jgi:hypothetical protein